MINRLKQLNNALPQLLVTIVVYGLAVEVIGVWFADDKLRYSTGLLIGIGCAIFMAVHLAIVIETAVNLGEGHLGRLKAKSVARYLIVVLVFAVMMYFKLGSLIPAFIGVFGLKVCAYAQPLINKILHKEEKTNEEEVKT